MGDISEAALTEAEKTVAKKIQDAPKFKSSVQGSFEYHKRHANKELARLEDRLGQLELKKTIVERKLDNHFERWDGIWTVRKSNIVNKRCCSTASAGILDGLPKASSSFKLSPAPFSLMRRPVTALTAL